MNGGLLALVGLRAAALALSFAGQTKASTALYALADAAEAGKNVDDHMALVAEKLKSRTVTSADWAEVTARIEADADRLHSG